jgi:hypothetical protein
VLGVLLALDLLKVSVCNHVMEVAQGARIAELESENVKLWLELEQARQVLAEADAARSSLSVNQEELERGCMGLRAAVDMLKQEKIQVLTNREAAVAAEQNKFQDYRLGHHEKLCELHANLEGTLNDIGAQCLPYPGKGSTITEVVACFKEEIRVLPDAIAKANNNFLVYCLIGVLKMLPGHAKCHRIDELGVVMDSCDASILDEVLEDIVKLFARIVKRWWSSYGLPYDTKAFRVELEVRLLITICCNICRLLLICLCAMV